MRNYKKLWVTLIVVLAVTFSILGWLGHEVYRAAPPVPERVVNESGEVIMTKNDILEGQSAWQTTGGMQLGSIWGHGAYQAPDWTADWLHREALHWLDIKAMEVKGVKFDALDEASKGELLALLKSEYRGDQVDSTGTVRISNTRAKAIALTAEYYQGLYGDDPAYKKTREHFAMKDGTLPDPKEREYLTDFFFWTSWAASAQRPGTEATYTNNWPHEPLIGNTPSAENVFWSVASMVFLLAGIGLLVWGWSFLRKEEPAPETPKEDPLTLVNLTPSQKALWKYLVVVVALFTLQVFLGGFTAHYTVEGQQFYGIDVSQIFPYALTRTWHIQSALFWIATAFLAAGLFLAPIINGGKDPKHQKLGVDLLFWALVVVVAGTFLGNFLALSHVIPKSWNFWFGHQGYEFLDLGRFWQLLLFVGFVFWLGLMLRGVLNAFKQPGDKNLLALFVASVIAVGLFYGSGLFYGERTNLSIMEYWRWWVVHLWVEGFFEVFATASMAFIFVSLGLVNKKLATASVLASASLFMVGGVPGTFHHMYFAGTTTPIMAFGASFSALEVVPLILLGHEAWEHWTLQKKSPWMNKLKWPIWFFVAVAFWNMFGAGVFGFMINPPISLYYIQGLNTTAVHAHAALFGVYGFLGIGFVALVARYIFPDIDFNDKVMKVAFWGLNLGLVLMIVISLLPIGAMQAFASISEGMWYARSEEFLQQPIFQSLRWWRTLGDVVFIVGALAFAYEIVRMSWVKVIKKNDV